MHKLKSNTENEQANSSETKHFVSKNSNASPAEWKNLELTDSEIYKTILNKDWSMSSVEVFKGSSLHFTSQVLKKRLKRLQRERMDGTRPYKERLKNLLNNVHSVRIQTSQDNSWILVEKIQEETGSETDFDSE